MEKLSSIHAAVQNLTDLKNLRRDKEMLRATRMSTLTSIFSEFQHLNNNVITELVGRLREMTNEGNHVKNQQTILQSLTFSKIKQRKIAISPKHEKTFHWILDSKTSIFAQWLAEGQGLFWVKGKPGSGKSTLMKFLATHHGTETRLQTRSSRRRLVVASHFFWSSGNSMQKSLQGLWQTLLYQVLKECPELIKTVCPSRWATLESPGRQSDAWDDTELLSIMRELARLGSLPLDFCFFIDGLDEYTSGNLSYDGTFDELIEPIRSLAASRHIKICVSSRPWNFFEKALGQGNQIIRLEDLTKNDIYQYVGDELDKNQQFQTLARNDERFDGISSIIVRRAEGVFLWVYLVIQSLKRGLVHDDSYEAFEKRLLQIPDGLERLFTKMLNNIDKVYRNETSRFLRTMIAAHQSLPLLAISFLEKEVADPGHITGMAVGSLSSQYAHTESFRLKTRINACCQDLLSCTENLKESDPIARYQVDFIHRTARDFFLDDKNQHEHLDSHASHSFNPCLALCSIMLAMSKVFSIATESPSERSRVSTDLFTFVDSLMYYGRQIEETLINTESGASSSMAKASDSCGVEAVGALHEILDELDRSVSERFSEIGGHWMNLKDPPKGSFREYRQKTFLAGAIQAGLTLYVRTHLERRPDLMRQKRGRPLLDYALRPTMVTPVDISTWSSQGPTVSAVRALLELGSDPNEKVYTYDDQTPWQLFLMACYAHSRRDAEDSDVASDIATAIHLMISHGAQTRCSIKVDDRTELDVKQVVSSLRLPSYRKTEIWKLVDEENNKLSTLSSRIGSWLLWK